MTPNQRAPYERLALEHRESEKSGNTGGAFSSSSSKRGGASSGPASEVDNYKASIAASLMTSVTGSELVGTSKPRRERVRMFIEKLIREEMCESGVSEKEALCSRRWYFIKFVTFCRSDIPQDGYDPYYVLGEVGLVEYGLEDGITAEYHSFIAPNKIPLGYLSRCMDSERDVHKIPLESARNSRLVNDKTYAQIYRDIYEFVTRESDRVPLLFCMSEDMEETRFGLEYLYDESRRDGVRLPEMHENVSDLEWLVVGLADNQLSFVQSGELLSRYSYDYSSQTRCEYHDEEGVICCALGLVKRKAYLISDHLCPMHGIQVTPAHLPVESAACETVEDDLAEFRFKYRQAAAGLGWRGYRSELQNGRAPKQARSGYDSSYDIR